MIQLRQVAEAGGKPWPDATRPFTAGESFVATIGEMAEALVQLEYANHVKGARK